jgi:hypothetical protein
MSETSPSSQTPQGGPVFLLAIDTEGDDIWARPRAPTTRNARFLPRFQAICERYGFVPTYLTNFEMANDACFVEMAKDASARGAAEVGMHMHAWDTPPIEPLGDQDWRDQPYATEFPSEQIDRKAEFMTRLLEDKFQAPITSHRAGRWGFCASYARSLIRLGYEVDCSVTPGVSWAMHPGLADGAGGVDYSSFPNKPYWIDPDDISRPGPSAFLEVPMTIIEQERPWHRALVRRLLGRQGPRLIWLSPQPGNLGNLLQIVEQKRQESADYIQFTLHSSEFMPGGSPTFPTNESIEQLYRDLEQLFEKISRHFSGSGLTAYARRLRALPARREACER